MTTDIRKPTKRVAKNTSAGSLQLERLGVTDLLLRSLAVIVRFRVLSVAGPCCIANWQRFHGANALHVSLRGIRNQERLFAGEVAGFHLDLAVP